MEYLYTEKLSNLEKKISKTLMDNIENLEGMSITDVSNLANVSPATITKYTKKLGFNGYKELKFRLIQDGGKLEIKDNYILDQKAKVDDFFAHINVEKLKNLANALRTADYICMYGQDSLLEICKYFSSKIKEVTKVPVIVYDDEEILDIELNNKNNNRIFIFLVTCSDKNNINIKIEKIMEQDDKIYIINDTICDMNNINKGNVVTLSSNPTTSNYFTIKDRSLINLYLEILLKTLEQ